MQHHTHKLRDPLSLTSGEKAPKSCFSFGLKCFIQYVTPYTLRLLVPVIPSSCLGERNKLQSFLSDYGQLPAKERDDASLLGA